MVNVEYVNFFPLEAGVKRLNNELEELQSKGYKIIQLIPIGSTGILVMFEKKEHKTING